MRSAKSVIARLRPSKCSVVLVHFAVMVMQSVLDQLRMLLRPADQIHEMLPQAVQTDPTLDEAKTTVAMTRLDAICDKLFPAEQQRIVQLLVEQVLWSRLHEDRPASRNYLLDNASGSTHSASHTYCLL